MLIVLIFGGNLHIVQKNTQVLLVTSKKTGLEVKTKFIAMYRDQNVGWSHKFLWKGGRIQIFGNLLAYSIEQSPWELTGFQIVKNFPVFHGTRRFITAFISARHMSLSWVNSIQSIPPHTTSWRSIVILFSSTPGSPKWSLTSGFPTKTLCTPLLSPIRAACPIHLILLDFITRKILGEE